MKWGGGGVGYEFSDASLTCLCLFAMIVDHDLYNMGIPTVREGE